MLATIDLNPAGKTARASVIWLHGLGASGHDFVPIVERFNARLQSEVRFVFPHAPLRAVTVNAGMEMPAWYDILGPDLNVNEDSVGIMDAEQQVRLLIEREQQLGIETNHIVLAGFSQGGAVALHTGLRFNQPLAGIISLSGYFPTAETVLKTRDRHNQSTPLFIAHGIFDHLVAFSLGQKTKEVLEPLGYSVEWRSYPMAHTVTAEEIEDINQFLLKILI